MKTKQDNVARWWGAVRARPYVAGSIFALSQLTALAAWVALPHFYRAEAEVLLDTAPSPFQYVQDDRNFNVLAARVALLKSRLMADRVVARLQFDSSQMLKDSWSQLGPDRPSFEEWLARMVSGGLVPNLGEGTYMLKVGYASPAPDFAAALANAYASELVEAVDVLNRGYDRLAGRKVDASVTDAKSRWLASQLALQAAAVASASLLPGLSDPALRQHMMLDRMAERKATEFIGGQAANAAFANLADPGSALDDSYLTKQQNTLGDLLSQRAGAVTSMGEAHPVVKSLDANIQAIRNSMALYKSKRMASLSAGVQVSRSVSARTGAEAAESKDQLLQGVRQRLAYDQLAAATEQAGEAYELFLADQAVIALNRDVPRADLRVMSAASLPSVAWFPNWRYYVPLSLTMGLLYAFLGCVWIGRRDRRIHSAADLVGWTGAELAGVIPKG